MSMNSLEDYILAVYRRDIAPLFVYLFHNCVTEFLLLLINPTLYYQMSQSVLTCWLCIIFGEFYTTPSSLFQYICIHTDHNLTKCSCDFFFSLHFHRLDNFCLFLHLKQPYIHLTMSATPDQPNPLVYFDIMVQDFDSGLVSYLGRVVMELRKDLLPKTCESFRALCTGECGVGVNGKPLHFKGSIFHRIVRDFCVQGGDITKCMLY